MQTQTTLGRLTTHIVNFTKRLRLYQEQVRSLYVELKQIKRIISSKKKDWIINTGMPEHADVVVEAELKKRRELVSKCQIFESKICSHKKALRQLHKLLNDYRKSKKQ